MLDRSRWRSYYPLVVAALVGAGCTPRLTSIAPVDLVPIPADSAAGWARAFRPAAPLQYELRWRFENRQGRSAGRATVRYAPPDTVRFDYRGPFGRSGSAVVVGGEAVWAEPEGDFRSLIPVAPVFWAALGVTLPPPAEAMVYGRDGPRRRAWRYVDGNEAIDFIHLREQSRFLAELRRDDRIAGVADVELAAASRAPVGAVMRFPADGSRLSFTVTSIDTVASHPPETWIREP
ncbi:MAG: hypothetical protein OER21_03450 [Gemmatimonadota bacterium]|nr:hypothetical protein [Gemmatimonadota bacterium]